MKGMMKPSILKEVAHMTEYMSRKQIRLEKKKRRNRVKNSLSGISNVLIKQPTRGKGCRYMLDRLDIPKHTIYVTENHKSACNEICRANRLKRSFHMIVPSPLFDTKEEEWITLESGFKYCYREHFIVDVSYLKYLKKITNATELHYSLGSFSVGRVNLIQPCESQNTRFCIVTSQQFECLKKRAGIQTIRAENNSYLYEYSDKASWSLPGCMVSSWEKHEKLPEFTMKEAENVAKAVGKGTKRRRTKNKGVFLTLGPRLSSRPRPNPTIQDENKLYFSDFFRQDWGGQEGMYLLRSKLCLATELARQRSIALNPGYMCLVGHYCCARQLLTSGICKPADCDEDCDLNTLGYVNSLHDDSCDLVAKKLVPLFINRFVNKIMSLKRVALSKKIKLTKKLKK